MQMNLSFSKPKVGNILRRKRWIRETWNKPLLLPLWFSSSEPLILKGICVLHIVSGTLVSFSLSLWLGKVWGRGGRCKHQEGQLVLGLPNCGRQVKHLCTMCGSFPFLAWQPQAETQPTVRGTLQYINAQVACQKPSRKWIFGTGDNWKMEKPL